MSNGIILNAEGIRAGYGANEILFGINMKAETGKIVTIIGPNGCGKSTFLKTLIGLVPWAKGKLEFDGKDILGLSPEKRSAAGISYVPQLSGVFASLTVLENLQLGAWSLSKAQAKTKIDELIQTFPVLKRFLNRHAGVLSGGERQIVALSAALMTDPRLLLIDEPSAGLSPVAAAGIFDHIESLRSSERAIMIVEQNAQISLSISDWGYVLAGGLNEFDGTPEDILGNEKVRKAYLGG
ncbi:ABC transporter ATP-binding protein [Pseudochrobactrum sp. MP213Fo]|uniref:ABC transporter ATP-binding protein n=1 Tax=Pseudochrobactrum sp. MP213Fo TaxID=3022250 RepID=UPI003BA3894C